MAYSGLQGVPALQFLPQCAALVCYGGGDDFRQGEALMSVPLAATALPPGLRSGVEEAVDDALRAAPAAAAAGEFAAERQPSSWDRDSCCWDVAFAVAAEPRRGSAWANLYFHGWLFAPHVGAGAANGGTEGPQAVQLFPLCGVWDASAGMGAFEGDATGGYGGGHGDARAAGVGSLRAADQHIHKVDAYAGGDREGTISLYIEQGFSREAAEAAVVAAELESTQYHVGSDCARVRLDLHAGRAADDGGVAIAWAVCIDLSRPHAPRAQATLLLAVADGATARWARRWLPAGGMDTPAETARAQLLADLPAAELGSEIEARIAKALTSEA